MIFTIIYKCLLDKSDKSEKTFLTFIFGIPIYIILFTINLFYFYSSLLIGIDLFTLQTIIFNKQQSQQQSITNQITPLLIKWFDYKNDIIKDYKPKNVQINDVIEHTLENLK